MTTTKSKRRQNKNDALIPLKREISGFFCLAVGLFLWVCLSSYHPHDPSLFSKVSHTQIFNSGGWLGAHVAGFFYYLFGAGSYGLAFYFIINAFLLLFKSRHHLRLTDFFVFMVASIFLSTFFDLYIGYLETQTQNVLAGGVAGKVLQEAGRQVLGVIGLNIVVILGGVVTFVIATRLSFIDTVHHSTGVVSKSFEGLGSKTLVGLVRVQKFLLQTMAKWKSSRDTASKQVLTKTSLSEKVSETLSAPHESKWHEVIEPKISQRQHKEPKKSIQQLELVQSDYQLPLLSFLDHVESKPLDVDEKSLRLGATLLESKFKDFDIEGCVTEIHPGPVITMFEFQPAPGVKLSRISSLSDDLSLAMGGRPVRIIAPLPNKAAIGIEIPNHGREIVWLKDIILDDAFQKSDSRLMFALGKNTDGIPLVADLQKMPHLLVAGSTGSGKSVSVNTMICSILYKARPDEVRLIMIDPKMIELSIYEGIPHLLLPVVTDPKKANMALRWAVREMERRYTLLADVNARHLTMYNQKFDSGELKVTSDVAQPVENKPLVKHDGKLPFIVIIIDEFADLMMVSSKEVEESVCRLAQKARAAGIHVIIATQRPSVDVITGIIKANFPSRIAFRVTSKHDSRTIIDKVGAEHLLGQGDMLFMPPGSNRMTRLHGAFVSENEIVHIVNFLKKQAKPCYNEEILKPIEEEQENNFASGDLDEFYDHAVKQVCETKRVSISSIQRQFRIGYNRAARIVDQMEAQGVVSAPNHQGGRQVLADSL